LSSTSLAILASAHRIKPLTDSAVLSYIIISDYVLLLLLIISDQCRHA